MTGITAMIPHRPPILLVDEVSEVHPGKSLTAWKTLEPQHFFEASPVYPVSLVLESWAQAAVLLVCWDRPNPDVLTGKAALATGIRDVELLSPVRTGDLLEHRVELVRLLEDAAILTGTSLVEGRPVLGIGQFTMALRAVEALRPHAKEG